MYAIAVSNHKGGVAKTTTALSLAAALAQRGRRVLAVDLDPQGNLGMGAGVVAREGPTTFDVLRGKVPAKKAARRVPHGGLELMRLIPASVRLAQADGWLYGKMGYDEVLRERLEGLARTTEFCVLDCPPSLGALTMNALVCSDLVLAPVQCEHFSAQGVHSLKELVDLVREQRRPQLQFRVLPTLYDQRNRICKQVLAKLRADFAGAASEVVVGIDTRVREAQAKGEPLGIYAPGSRATRAYADLAAEVETLAARAGAEAAKAAKAAKKAAKAEKAAKAA